MRSVQALSHDRIREILTPLAETEVSEIVRRIQEQAARRAKRPPAFAVEPEVEDESRPVDDAITAARGLYPTSRNRVPLDHR